MKKVFSAVLAMILVIACYTVTSFAVESLSTANGRKVVEVVKDTRIYKTKNYSSSNHVTDLYDGYLPTGARVEIISATAGTADSTQDRTWVQVKYLNGSNAFQTKYACVKDGTEYFDGIVFYDGVRYEKTLMTRGRNIRATASNSGALVCSASSGTEIYIAGIQPNSATNGKWFSVLYSDNGTLKPGYIYQPNAAFGTVSTTGDDSENEYFENYVVNSNGNRRAFAQGCHDKVQFGDKTPVYSSKSTSSSIKNRLRFGAEVFVVSTEFASTNKEDIWWTIEYKIEGDTESSAFRTGYIYQKNTGASPLNYVNVRRIDDYQLDSDQQALRSKAYALREKGTSLQYNNADRYLATVSGFTNRQPLVNELFTLTPNSTPERNIDCSSFTYSVYLKALNRRIPGKTKTLMDFATLHPNATDVIMCLDQDGFRDYYNDYTMAHYANRLGVIKANELATDAGLKVGDLIVMRSDPNGGNDTSEGNGHVMMVYSIQKNVKNQIENVVLIHSTGDNNAHEQYGTVQFISLSARFIGDRHTKNLTGFAILRPTRDIKWDGTGYQN